MFFFFSEHVVFTCKFLLQSSPHQSFLVPGRFRHHDRQQRHRRERFPLTCPNCNYLDFQPVSSLLHRTRPELIEHLESMVLVKEQGGSRAHALINHFIPTIEGDIGICYTYPKNLPGVTRDGHSRHFFHRTTKAYPTSTRTRRKIMSEHGQCSSEDVGEAHWHRTGNTRPVNVGCKQKGFIKILVLHNVKHVE
ncbi:hypothetical protein SORBI_3006G003850 [Sorghum bicolor]|uniref:NAC domain-containing protein n=1 Tax=Sorghum bicolor TaxID=4558 RepID=A0A1Z5RBB3_SORBI|nr:hypothetical protein SORBI_3006G003850 [Sorghum bicolor]